MNYPVWYLPGVGGGILIALIAIIHVFISHFAVGGGLYLVLAERKGLREKNFGIVEFTRRHAKFFLLVTMVLGGLTGVGIWFVISLVQPAATSLLIHLFVFGWATEWVFFLVEIVALFVYVYTFGRLKPRTHLTVGWIYFISAWFSLFLINGIIGFMLTPGAWLASRDFWGAFFNPSFWPALLFRTCIACMLAGIYAFVTTSFLRDRPLKWTMSHFSGRWVLISLTAAIPCGYWYLSVLPKPVRSLVAGGSPTIDRAISWGLYAAAAILLLTLVMVLIKPGWHNRPVAVLVLACGLVYIGAFEWAREAGRRPYVINQVMYSNGIPSDRVEELDRDGFLSAARWVSIREFHAESQLEIGRDLFKHQCYACHTVGGFNNDILSRTAGISQSALFSYLENLHQSRYFMPPFVGNADERGALAAYIAVALNGQPAAPDAGRELTGAEIFSENCAFCHDITLVRAKIHNWDQPRIRGALDRLSELNPVMPDFDAPAAEKDLLATYLAGTNDQHMSAAGPGLSTGEGVFETHCAMCHTLRGGGNPLVPRLADWDRERIREALDMLNRLQPMMPDLQAPAEEKDALALFLFEESRGGSR